MYVVELVYKADTAQMRHDERAANKGRGLKIGKEQKLADYIEKKIKDEKWSPDAVIGRIRAEGSIRHPSARKRSAIASTKGFFGK